MSEMRDEDCENTPISSRDNCEFSSNSTVVKDLHLEKQREYRVVTEAGRRIDNRDKHSAKTSGSLIDNSELGGNSTTRSAVQELKQPDDRISTEGGTAIKLISVIEAKRPSTNALTFNSGS
jgi:hypothetical protein